MDAFFANNLFEKRCGAGKRKFSNILCARTRGEIFGKCVFKHLRRKV